MRAWGWILPAKSGNFVRKKSPVREVPGESAFRPNRLSRNSPLELEW